LKLGFGNHQGNLLLGRLPVILHTARVRTSNSTNITLLNTHPPEIFKTQLAENMSAGKLVALGTLKGRQADGAGVGITRELF